MKKLTAAILLLTILISSFAFADDSVSYDYIMRIPMEDGYVVWDMMGTMRYVDNEGNVLWGEPFETDETFEETEEIDSIEDDTRTDMQRLTGVDKIYPFENGYTCVVDEDDQLHYFDGDGKEVYNFGFEEYSSSYRPIMPSNDMLFGYAGKEETASFYKEDYYKITDIEGNVLWRFYESDYNAFGTLSEGLIMVEGETKALSGNAPYVAYYSPNGQEKLRFDGKLSVGDESNFHQGLAFLCEMSKNDEYDYIGEGWPVNWVMIDTAGNMIDLKISNPEDVESLWDGVEYYKEHCEQYGSDPNKIVSGLVIYDIAPFSSGEEYTSAIIYAYCGEGWLSEEIKLLASVSREGVIKLLHNVDNINDPRAKICYNGKCVMSSGKVFDVTNGNILDVTSIPSFSAGTSFSTYLMDDGNIYVFVRNSEGDIYCSIVTFEGNIVEEPKLIDRNAVETLLEFNKAFTGKRPGNQYYWQNFGKSENKIIEKNQLYAFRDQYYGFYDIYGNVVIEPQYTLASDFNNGYAVVCTNQTTNQYGAVNRCDLAFINTNGEIVERAEF